MMGVFYDGSLFLWLCGFELVVNNSEEKQNIVKCLLIMERIRMSSVSVRVKAESQGMLCFKK